MLHKYFAIIAIVFLLIPTLNAQDVERFGGYARVQALGENPYVVDPEFMKSNPAWGQFYDNFLWTDIGSAETGDYPEGNGQFFGVNFRLDNDWTLGAIMSRDDFNSMSIGMLDPFGITMLHNPPLNNNLELFSTLKMGNTSLGLGLAYASASTENNPEVGTNSTTDASQIGVNLGLLSNFTRSMMLDLGVSVVLPTYGSTQNEGDVDISQTIIAANARIFWKFSNKVRLVPNVTFLNATGTSDSPAGSSDLPSYMALGVGVGLEYTVGDFMFIGGPAFRTTSVTDNDPEETTTTFPAWNVGAEWDATEWLVARLGYVAENGYVTTTTENVGEVIQTQYRPGMVTMGLGLRFGDFGFDATINSSVVRGGLANIGGEPTFAYVSASYGF